MNKASLVFLSAIGVLGLASACSVDTALPEEAVAEEQALCENPQGANYALAALAASTAKELRRWQTSIDFRITTKYNYSMAGWQEVVELTPTGKSRCYDGVCKNTQAILDLQKKETTGTIRYADGQMHQADIFSQRLVANLKAQITCNSRPSNGGYGNCPVEQHDLEFSRMVYPAGCEADYWFHAYKAGTKQPLQYPAQLKNQLITFGSMAGNPYLAFDTQGDDVKVDPGPGTMEGDPQTSGSCPVMGSSNMKVSTVDISNTCCEYTPGTRKSFVRSAANPIIFTCSGPAR